MPQDKKPLGLSKPKKLSVSRVRQIADSLEKSYKDKYEFLAKTAIRVGKADDSYDARKFSKSAAKDYFESNRLRKLANDASKKKK